MLTRNGKAPGSAANDHEGQKFVDTGERDKRSCSRTQNLAQVSLHYGDSTKVLATVAPDPLWPAMFRVQWPDGSLSDLGNVSRIRDAAEALCERGPPRRDPRRFHWHLHRCEMPAEAPPH